MQKGKFEVFDWDNRQRDAVNRKFDSQQDYEKEYARHVGYGASGFFDTNDKRGVITSFAAICKKLESQGYKNVGFCNGGDDDNLVVDHSKKVFGFLEDLPCDEVFERANRIEDL